MPFARMSAIEYLDLEIPVDPACSVTCWSQITQAAAYASGVGRLQVAVPAWTAS